MGSCALFCLLAGFRAGLSRRGCPRGGGSVTELEPFYGVPATPWRVSTVPRHLQGTCRHRRSGHLANLTAGHALQPLVPRPQAPGSGSAWGREAAGPPRALHLKEISWDPQKPATLIAGILFLVSFEGSLQVFGVISGEPAGHWAPLCPSRFLATRPQQ